MIYFDYNATAPVMREAREAWLHVTEPVSYTHLTLPTILRV